MNIVYGVSGEGLGHVYEAIQVVERLRNEGHSVKVLTYGERAVRSLAAFNPTKIEGIHLKVGPGGMSVSRTVAGNLGILPFYAGNWGRLMREIEDFEPDLFVTAYEPFTMIASHVFGLPLVSMDNQNELMHAKAPPGTHLPSLWLVKLATFLCTYGARYYVIKSLVRRGSSGARVRFVSPVIQREIRALETRQDGPVLVYLTKPNPGLLEVLRQVDQDFVVYCRNPVGRQGNLTFRAQGGSYLEDLGAARAIIATTGFSLISDALYLKKPYFGVPVRGQFEQVYNAHFIGRLGIGASSESPTPDDIRCFLENLGSYRARLLECNLDPADQENALLEIIQEVASEEPRPVAVS